MIIMTMAMKMVTMVMMTNSMKCVSLMTEVGLLQASPSDPLPGLLSEPDDEDFNRNDENVVTKSVLEILEIQKYWKYRNTGNTEIL